MNYGAISSAANTFCTTHSSFLWGYYITEGKYSVVNDGAISSANSLYTTQSSISKRINLLEDEAGVPLLVRGKGSCKIKLTPHGEAFLSIARKWEALKFTRSL